jgi:HPt (histidine-containing phosphotransfer) domain-containing protein
MPDAVIDRATFDATLQAVGGDPSFLAELVDAFASDGPAQIQAMRDGLAGGDAFTVTRAAHSLKSTSASLGASALADAAGSVEASARGGDLVDLPPSVDALERGLAVALAELRSLLPAA